MALGPKLCTIFVGEELANVLLIEVELFYWKRRVEQGWGWVYYTEEHIGILKLFKEKISKITNFIIKFELNIKAQRIRIDIKWLIRILKKSICYIMNSIFNDLYNKLDTKYDE